jgi:hypothetical protein
MDKSGLRFVAHLIDRTTKKPSRKNQLKDAELQFRPVHAEGSRQLPRKSQLQITMAIAEVVDFPDPGFNKTPKLPRGIFDGGYALRIEMENKTNWEYGLL